jgi:phage-related tail fiber protein
VISGNFSIPVESLSNAPNPIVAGTIAYLGMNSAPSGWLKANGAAVSRTTYAALFTAIGTTYGVGDGSTTFNLPDLRGEFPRGWDDGRGVDSSRAIGTWQDEQTRLYKATYQGSNAQSSYRGGPFDGAGEGKDVNSSAQTMQRWYRDWQDGQSERGLLNTRPRNVALLACIKF